MRRTHPIEQLMEGAESEYQALISRQKTSLDAAARAYRQRRGRHPPPGFDAWIEFAQRNKALIVEDMFDQVYRDLDPFWGVSAKSMRDFAGHYEHRISVKNGIASMTQNHHPGTATDRMEAWLDLMKSVQGMLPDIDVSLNVMDESRVIVPWEDTSRHLQSEKETRNTLAYENVTSSYLSHNSSTNLSPEPPQIDWMGPGERYWDMARVACAPGSPARSQAAAKDLAGPPPRISRFPERSHKGYVQNWTHVRDPCQQPHLQESHGTFIEPVSISTTRALVPIFSESKLQLNSDILIPPAAYLSEHFSGGGYSDTKADGGDWKKKKSGVIWRGAASGGRNKQETWTRYQRHRFVSMLNGTYVEKAEAKLDAGSQGQTFVPQSYTTYQLSAARHMNVGTWLDRIANVGFTDLLCWPSTGKPTCGYTDPYFKIVDKVSMAKQFKYKLLPDIDGNSFSGRYLAFLRSTSVPIKATIYSEWHDDRLIPWLHFVPMDNSFVDVYGILDYFLGSGDKDSHEAAYDAHDEEAKKIALSGKEWASRALRKEDMQIYMLRLLLEYARLCDDDRERLGFVGDLDTP